VNLGKVETPLGILAFLKDLGRGNHQLKING
jgi:hypothetical protein